VKCLQKQALRNDIAYCDNVEKIGKQSASLVFRVSFGKTVGT